MTTAVQLASLPRWEWPAPALQGSELSALASRRPGLFLAGGLLSARSSILDLSLLVGGAVLWHGTDGGRATSARRFTDAESGTPGQLRAAMTLFLAPGGPAPRTRSIEGGTKLLRPGATLPSHTRAGLEAGSSAWQRTISYLRLSPRRAGKVVVLPGLMAGIVKGTDS